MPLGLRAQTSTFTPTWVQQSPATSPALRDNAAIAYNSATGLVTLFAGYNGSSYLSDTWTYNGTTWTQQTPATSPPARYTGTMVYDTALNELVLFGGYGSSGYLGDTWTYNGTTWAQQSPATSPTARQFSEMTYDAATGLVVLFGGNDSGTIGSDTWTYNGTTWTQQSPATSPLARRGAAMTYDPATGLVVLFGGNNGTTYFTDTWTYNGTTWTQQSPATSPPQRYGATLVYDSAVEQLVLFGGYNGTSYLADTWTYNGTTWTQQSPVTSPAGKEYANVAYDNATSQVVLFSGYTSSGYVADTWALQLGAANFGSVAVATGSQQETLTFTFGTGGSILAPVVLLQGTAGLDFTDAGTGTCTTNGAGYPYAAGATCTVVVNFAPSAPGTRFGAVELLSSSDTLIASQLIYGTGTGPLGVFIPGTLSTVAGTGSSCGDATPVPACGDGGLATAATLLQPGGVALDGAGNLYIADTNDHRIRKVTTAGIISTYAGTGATCPNQTAGSGACGDGGLATAATFHYPSGIGLDGAGNLYIADYGDNRIRKITAATGIVSTVAGTGGACPNPTASSGACGDGAAATSGTMNSPQAVTVDAAGNVYFADVFDNRVRMVTTSTGLISTLAGNGTQCSTPTAASNPCGDGSTAASGNTSLNYPQGVAVDGSGNVYIGDAGDQRVREVTAATGVVSSVAGNGTACTTSSSTGCGDGTTAANGTAELNNPTGIAVDAAGDVYIGDGTQRVRKVAGGLLLTVAGNGTQCGSKTATCGDGSAATGTGSTAEFNAPTQMTLDKLGNLYLVDANDYRIRKVTATASPLSFASTMVGSATAVQTVTLANIGNTSLTPTVMSTTSNDFTLTAPTGTCAAATAIPFGNSCTVSVEFTPQSVDALIGDANITDNNLNLAGTMQQIALSGTGLADTDSTLVFENYPNQATLVSASNTIAAGTNPGVVTVAVTNSAGTINYASTDQIQLVVQETISGSTTTVGTYKTNVTSGYVSPTLTGGIATFDLSTVAQYAVGATAVYTYTLTDLTNTLTAVSAYVNVAPLSSISGNGASARVMLVTSVASTQDTAGTALTNCPDQNVASPTSTITCTLADALETAETSGGAYAGSTILFKYTGTPLTILASTTLSGTTIKFSTTFSGPGMTNLILTGAASAVSTTPVNEIFRESSAIAAGAVVNFSGMTLEYGGLTTASNGGALYVYGATNVSNVKFLGNSSVTNSGGAIYRVSTATGALNISNCIFQGNNTTSATGGGAISDGELASGTSLTISNTSFIGNYATGNGGAILIIGVPTVNITGSLFSGNYSSGYSGGAIAIGGTGQTSIVTTALTNDTFYGNYAGGAVGGAVYLTGLATYVNSTTLQYVTMVGNYLTNATSTGGGVSSGAYNNLTIMNSVVAANYIKSSTGFPDLAYYITPTHAFSGSIFTISTGALSGGYYYSSYSQASLGLAALGSYGGPTQVMLPLPGSTLLKNTTVASAGATPSSTGASPISTVTTDARGFARPSTGGKGLVDIGAVQSDLSLVFNSTLPSSTVVGGAFNQQPVVEVYESGYPLLYAVPITMSLSAGTISGTATVSTSASTGIATFSGLYSDTPETGVDLVASAGTYEADLGGFNITSAVSQIVFGTAPAATLTAGGNAGSSVTVNLENSSNAIVSADSSVITLAVTGPNGYAASYTATAASGTATFNLGSLVLYKAGTYSYAASYPAGYTVTASETVNVGAVTHLEASEPSTTVTGFPYTTTVSALDVGQNVVPGFTGTATLTSSDASATLPAMYTFTGADNGVHSFSTTLSTAGTQTVTATSSSPSDTGTQTSIIVEDSIWLLNATGSVVAGNEAGAGVTGAVGSAGTSSTAGGVAFDSTGNVWSVTNQNNALDFNNKTGTGAVIYSGGGLNAPVAVMADGAGYIWIANSGSASVSEFNNSGTAVSGTSGYGASGSAALGSAPSALAIDETGGVWIVSKTGNTVGHMLGVATPVTTPTATAVTNGTLGAKP